MIREDCKELNMTLQEATHLTRDRRAWRKTTDEWLTRATGSPGSRRRREKTIAKIQSLS